MATRLGVDVGGTFTDLLYYDDKSGEVHVAKVPSTPDSPERGIRHALDVALSPRQLQASQYFLHGTTVGLNAILERRGATVGMLCTTGFRDVLELGRGDRGDPYDPFWQRGTPLVPRRLRSPVTERMRADGTIHTAIDEVDVAAAAALFAAEGVEAVAVCFLHAWANPEHELAAEAMLKRHGFNGAITLSHRVSREYREYERTTTAVVDAYVRPVMVRYLGMLADELERASFAGIPLVTRSGGGAMTFAEASARPFETIMSGPVAGAEGAASLARALGHDDVITADVGGTSFDTCVIRDGRASVLHQGTIDGLPLQTSWVDVRSIGAGGGSIAYADIGGLLRVGPRSAGAQPGPACYGKGGEEPTVTDAAFLLGMLGHGRLASDISLDADRAAKAVSRVAEPLGLSIEAAARGILRIACSSMADAIREITVEAGRDPREATLMAFGGAGPLFAANLAEELDITRIVLPKHAGNFSASGLLDAELTQSAARTTVLALDEVAIAEASRVLEELYDEVESRRDGGYPPDAAHEAALDMRFAGQEHTLTVAVPSTRSALSIGTEDLRQTFLAEYASTFGDVMEEPVEIVSTRATVRVPLAQRKGSGSADGSSTSNATGTLEAYSFTRDEWMTFSIYDRGTFGAGDEVAGPAILTEPTATFYLDAGWHGTVHELSGALVVTTEQE